MAADKKIENAPFERTVLNNADMRTYTVYYQKDRGVVQAKTVRP